MKKIASALLYMVAGVMPFVFSEYFLTPYIHGKVLFIRAIVFLLAALTAGFLWFGKPGERQALVLRVQTIWRGSFTRLLTILMGVLGISTLLAYDRTVAFFGESQRAEGFLTLFVLFVFFILTRLYFTSPKEWRTFFTTWIIGSFGIFFINCYQQFIVHTRPTGLSGNPTFMAGYMIVSLFAALWLLRQEKKNPSSGFRGALALCAVVTSLISMFFSENRATLLGLGITTVVLSFVVLVRRTKDVSARAYTKPAVLILSVLLVFGLFFGATRSAPFWQHVPGVARFATTTRSDGSLNSRILFVTESLGDFWSDGGPKRVLFGWGWDNYVFFWTKHYDTRVFYFDPAVADRAHDKFIDMLVMTGIVGLGVYLGIWWMFLKRISYKLRESFAEALPYLVFAGIYFFFLLATFDLVDTLIGFYALLAYLDYEKFS